MSMAKSKAIWLFLGLGVGVLIGLAVLIFRDLSPVDEQFIPSPGATLPNFSAQDLDGNPVSLDQVAGKPILINFWASWCQPCMEELPYLQQIYEQFGGDLIVIGINADDTLSDMRAVADELQLTFPIWNDPQGTISRKMLISALPTSYFIDQDGTILGSYIGIVDDSVVAKYFPAGGK